MELEEIQIGFLQKLKKYLDDKHGNDSVVLQQSLTEACIHMAEYQQKELAIPVEVISIVFLNTSYYLKKPMIRLFFFVKGMLWKEPLMYIDSNAEWLVKPMEIYEEQIADYARQYKKNKEWIEVEKRRMLRLLLKVTAYYIKYDVRDWCESEALQKIFKCDDFLITFGEYMDWQLTLHMQKSAKDISQCDEKEDLTFTQFDNVVYKKKNFSDLNLSGTIFRDCRFTNCTMENVSFRDAVFRNCIFERVVANHIEIYGTRFEGCLFKNCKSNDIKEEPLEQDLAEGFYRETEWIDCEVDDDAVLHIKDE